VSAVPRSDDLRAGQEPFGVSHEQGAEGALGRAARGQGSSDKSSARGRRTGARGSSGGRGSGARGSAGGRRSSEEASARRSGGAGPPVDPEAAAREICLRLLSFSPRTRAQLADALRRKGVPDDVAERVLGRYSEVGLIDDAAFARAWVQSRHAGRGLARRALADELRRRGVADETVKDAVEELDPAQEEAAARELVAKRMAATRGLDPAKRTRRILGGLARKGYSGGLAYRLVREALEAEGIEDLPDTPPEE
jgi:regulatory protein